MTMTRIVQWTGALSLLLGSVAAAGADSLPIREQWEGSYPTAELARLPEGQEMLATGVIGDPWEFRDVWAAWKPDTPPPALDFGREVVFFTRNTRYLNRLRIGAVNARDGLASLVSAETMTAIPIESECFLALAAVPRDGLRRVDAGGGTVAVPPPPRATFAYVRGDGAGPGALYARIRGKERRIADRAWKTWLGDGGRDILYTQQSGGGHENEGQSLHALSVSSGAARLLGSGDAVVHEVAEARSRHGQLLYLVTLRDGAVGAPTTWIVHPERGRLLLLRDARVAHIADGRVALNRYRRGAFDTARPEAVKPIRMQTVELDHLLATR
jgi:hypothetical protein